MTFITQDLVNLYYEIGITYSPKKFNAVRVRKISESEYYQLRSNSSSKTDTFAKDVNKEYAFRWICVSGGGATTWQTSKCIKPEFLLRIHLDYLGGGAGYKIESKDLDIRCSSNRNSTVWVRRILTSVNPRIRSVSVHGFTSILNLADVTANIRSLRWNGGDGSETTYAAGSTDNITSPIIKYCPTCA